LPSSRPWFILNPSTDSAVLSPRDCIVHHSLDTEHLDEALDRAAALLRRADRVAVLTGAGVSAESGVATFRGPAGLWEGHHVEDVATPRAFARDPVMVWRFYNQRRAGLRTVQPNPGHRALAALEQRWGSERFTLITQNIDGLHQAASSIHVLELHGRLSRVRCVGCDYIADRPREELPESPRCPDCGDWIRPDVVWFEEMLPQRIWREGREQTEACQCFLVIGTSAIVFPAAGLISTAKSAGAAVIEFNLEATAASSSADVCLHGPSGQLLPEVVRRLG
jgi:NAD-dependent deacetylase